MLVWKYVTSADTRAEHDKSFVPALVARSRIARGTVFDQALADNLFQTVKIPRDSLPPDRIVPATNAELLNLYKGKVAATDIFTGTPMISDQFVAASQLVSTVAGAIPEGRRGDHGEPRPDPRGGRLRDPGRPGEPARQLVAPGRHRPGRQPISVPESLRTTAFLLSGLKVIAVGSSTVLPPSPSGSTSNAGGPPRPPRRSRSRQPDHASGQPAPGGADRAGTSIGTLYMSLNPADFKAGDFKNPTEIVEAVNLFDQPLTEVNNVIAALPQAALTRLGNPTSTAREP